MNLQRIIRLLRHYYLTSSLFACCVGIWIEPVLAEGSKDMFPDGASGNRGHIEWRNDKALGEFKRRTLLRVFAKEDEYILVGSSTVGIDSGNIEIYNPGTVTGQAGNENIPNTANFTCSSQRTGQESGTGNGFIANRTQELEGPRSIDGTGNTDGYIPCSYQAPTTGIYFVAIYGPDGKNDNTSPNNGVEHSIGQINTGTNQNTGISAWDVTVRDSESSTTDLNGRLHTYFISINMGNNGHRLHSKLYPLTIDGYRYEIDLKGIDPFGFSIFGNLLGNLDSDGVSPLYHDVLGTNGSIDNPEGGTSTAPPQFPMFFNSLEGLDKTVLNFLPIYDPITGLQTGTGFAPSAITPIVTSPTYSGNVSGNKSTVNEGGSFSFDSNISGVYEITISRDGVDFNPTTPENRVLRGLMTNDGSQTVVWDGLDNTGEPFPVGEFDYSVQIHAGEYHFPISDAENNVNGGPSYTLLNATNPLGNSTAFYDHSGYYTVDGVLVPDAEARDGTAADGDPTNGSLCGLNPPNPPATDPVTGADSTSSNFNRFGQSAGGNTNNKCTGSFGDTKTLDLWTYRPSTRAENNLIIVQFDYGDAPLSYDNTADDNDVIDESDNPARHTPSTDLHFGDVAADAEVAPQSSENADGDDDATAPDVDDEDGISNFPNLESNDDSYSLTATVNNTSGTPTNVYAWIDFDGDGEFDEDERATVADGSITLDANGKVPTGSSGTVTLNWNNLGGTGADITEGDSYLRIRLTSNEIDQTVEITERDDASVGLADNGEVEDYQIAIAAASDPNLLLVKRITAVNRGSSNEVQFNSFVDDDSNNDGDFDNDPNDDPNWPNNDDIYLRGATSVADVQPGDEIEYTIYFLSNGEEQAKNVKICDVIPDNMSFVSNSYDGDSGIELLNSSANGATATNLSNFDDADAGRFYAPGTALPTVGNPPTNLCQKVDSAGNIISVGAAENINGAIVVEIESLPEATSPGTPVNSYGYIRFRARVQ